MTSLTQHSSSRFVKLIAIGDSKTRKTTSLGSLVKLGYKLRILDFDNLLHPLRSFVEAECPQFMDNIEYRTLRDQRKATADGPHVTPKAYIDGVKMLDRWKYKTEDGEVDLGVPAEWGPDCVLVIDSLSRWCDAAFDWRLPLTPRGKGGEIDKRATYGDAQKAVENNLSLLSSDNFETNVVIICHILYQEDDDGKIKGYPQGVGQKLSPKIPQYFPNVVLYKHKANSYVIQTKSTPMIDLAFSKPFDAEDEYDNATGLGEIFNVLKEPPIVASKPKLRKV